MKSFLQVLALSAAALAGSAQAEVAEQRAVVVQINGGIAGFDVEAHKTVLGIAGGLVASGKIKHFMTTAVGHEGGGIYCLELADEQPTDVSAMLTQFNEVKPNLETTFYKVQSSTVCSLPTIQQF